MNVATQRSSGSQPVGRSVRQRPTAAGLRPPADRAAGAAGRAPVRHIAPTSSQSRMRLQDPDPLLRDRIHPARIRGRQQQTQGRPTPNFMQIFPVLIFKKYQVCRPKDRIIAGLC